MRFQKVVWISKFQILFSRHSHKWVDLFLILSKVQDVSDRLGHSINFGLSDMFLIHVFKHFIEDFLSLILQFRTNFLLFWLCLLSEVVIISVPLFFLYTLEEFFNLLPVFFRHFHSRIFLISLLGSFFHEFLHIANVLPLFEVF